MILKLVPDGFEKAIIAKTLDQPGRPAVYIVDYAKCIEILMERDGMTAEIADEFLQFNTVGAWMGDATPVFSEPLDEEDLEELKELGKIQEATALVNTLRKK